MHETKSVEHYNKHELVTEVRPGSDGWGYRISVVLHKGDESEVRNEDSVVAYETELDAMQAARARGRELIDEFVASS